MAATTTPQTLSWPRSLHPDLALSKFPKLKRYRTEDECRGDLEGAPDKRRKAIRLENNSIHIWAIFEARVLPVAPLVEPGFGKRFTEVCADPDTASTLAEEAMVHCIVFAAINTLTATEAFATFAMANLEDLIRYYGSATSATCRDARAFQVDAAYLHVYVLYMVCDGITSHTLTLADSLVHTHTSDRTRFRSTLGTKQGSP